MDDPLLERRLSLRTRPEDSPVMYQTWRQLLFLHWRCDPQEVQQILPGGLTVETFDGSAWIGVVPFLMRNVRPVWAPITPYLSHFLELNVRTYAVDEAGTPGVWFLSLDASRLLAVGLARAWFKLPYFWAAMSNEKARDGGIRYRSRRRGSSRQSASEFRFEAQGTPAEAVPGSLEFFLIERYLLFAPWRSGGLATGRVHHVPYCIQPVSLDSHDGRSIELNGLHLPRPSCDHAVYSSGVDVEVFPLQPPGGSRR